jgi:hypothetical protein
VIQHVVGAPALKMYDQNFMPLAQPIADHGTPIVIDNACGPWRRLAEIFMAADARVYIGALLPVTTVEAQGVVAKLLGRYFGQSLPAALWSAQREVYGDAGGPYIMIGVYPQELSALGHDIPKHVASRLARALRRAKVGAKKTDAHDKHVLKAREEVIEFYKQEIAAMKRRWLNPMSGIFQKR